jgi:hypothetical protein
MRYTTLTESDLSVVARERLRELEIDHARYQLRLVEAVEPGEIAAVTAMLGDLERRMALYDCSGNTPESSPESSEARSEPVNGKAVHIGPGSES